MSRSAKSIILKSYADSGHPQRDHFEIVESAVSDPVGEGAIQVQIIAISADPYLRGRIKSSSPSKFTLNAPIAGFVVGRVIASNGNPDWIVGDLFGASLPLTTFQNISLPELKTTLIWKLTGLLTEEEITLGLGVLGMPGSTAYGGLIDVLRPNPGETIFISAASGAVGSLVGMIAKNVYNCTVIGSCGGPEKCHLIKEKFGFDYAIDYKVANDKDSLKEALTKAAPEGIDMYFENVGGYHFDAAFDLLRAHGRIAVCGGISQYNEAIPQLNVINPMKMIYTFQRIEGFMCSPWLSGKKGNFLMDMHSFLRSGKITAQETRFDGIESWVEGFQSLFTGANVGKVVVRL
jgi:NADPH-dependent curcumin reductase CurA